MHWPRIPRVYPPNGSRLATAQQEADLDEIRGRVQQLLSQGWGLAMAPLYRNAIFIMASSAVGGASGFVFYFIIARSYSVNDLGYAQGVFNTISFLATLALLGLGTALVRFLPSAENKVATINTCLTLTGLVAIPFTIILIAGIEFWLPSLDFILGSPIYWVLILLTTLSLTFAPILDQSGLAMRRADLILWRTILATVLRVPIALLLIFFAVAGGRLDSFVAHPLPVWIVLRGGIPEGRQLGGPPHRGTTRDHADARDPAPGHRGSVVLRPLRPRPFCGDQFSIRGWINRAAPHPHLRLHHRVVEQPPRHARLNPEADAAANRLGDHLEHGDAWPRIRPPTVERNHRVSGGYSRGFAFADPISLPRGTEVVWIRGGSARRGGLNVRGGGLGSPPTRERGSTGIETEMGPTQRNDFRRRGSGASSFRRPSDPARPRVLHRPRSCRVSAGR